jgi:hypothetical protein
MYVIDTELIGLAPILFNRMVDPSVLDNPVTGGKNKGAEARREEAAQKVYKSADGTLVMPAWTIKRMALDGARESKLKIDRTPLWRHIAAVVYADADGSFGVSTYDYIHEAVGLIPPRTGKAAIIRRPALDKGWHLAFRLNVLTDIPIDRLRAAFDVGGFFVGCGSWRPEYGRYEVSRFEVATGGKKKTAARK